MAPLTSQGSLQPQTRRQSLRLMAAGLASVITVGLAVSSGGAANAASKKVAVKAAKKDIVDTAVGAGSFKTLVAAVQAAGLVDTLKGPGPFTVFAPTDAAFAKLPKATLDGLLADKKALADILTYHVVSGKVLAKDSPTAAKVLGIRPDDDELPVGAPRNGRVSLITDRRRID